METLIALCIIAAIGVVCVLLPVGLSVFEEFSAPREVLCPLNGESASITADATYAAITSVVGMPRLRLAGCSLWTERGECSQTCLRRLTS
jgi:hypothetical protein